jgi:hypothetical protein
MHEQFVMYVQVLASESRVDPRVAVFVEQTPGLRAHESTRTASGAWRGVTASVV